MHNLYTSNRKISQRIDKNGEKITKNICYILQAFDSARFMASSLSNLVNNFVKELILSNVNSDMAIKNLKLVELNISITTVFLNTKILTEYKCLCCNKYYQHTFEEKLTIF